MDQKAVSNTVFSKIKKIQFYKNVYFFQNLRTIPASAEEQKLKFSN